jgi:hypothetical protein
MGACLTAILCQQGYDSKNHLTQFSTFQCKNFAPSLSFISSCFPVVVVFSRTLSRLSSVSYIFLCHTSTHRNFPLIFRGSCCFPFCKLHIIVWFRVHVHATMRQRHHMYSYVLHICIDSHRLLVCECGKFPFFDLIRHFFCSKLSM